MPVSVMPRFYNMVEMIPAVVLAAGQSTRMGRAKALLPLDRGDTFVTRIVRTFADAGVDDIIIVLGHDAERIASSIGAGLKPHDTLAGATDRRSAIVHPRIVVNDQYGRGQLSSLQAALAVADRPGVTAILMTLVDVPLVAASTVRAVLERYRETLAPIVRPVSGTRHGHPILIARSLFDALRAASDEAGAKPVVRAHASAVGDVPVEDEGAFRDIDTMAEYDALIRGADAAADRGSGPSAR